MNANVWMWFVSSTLFLTGGACVVFRRQLLAMILGLELMINAANLNIVYFAAQKQDARGMAIALLVIAVAAAEVVVGLSLILALNRSGVNTETQNIKNLAG